MAASAGDTDRGSPPARAAGLALGFGLFAESMRATTVSSETWEDRIRRMSVQFDEAAGSP